MYGVIGLFPCESQPLPNVLSFFYIWSVNAKKNLAFPGLSIKSTGSFVVNMCFNHSYINNVSHGLLVANTCFSHSYINNVSYGLLVANTCFSHGYISNASHGLLLASCYCNLTIMDDFQHSFTSLSSYKKYAMRFKSRTLIGNELWL